MLKKGAKKSILGLMFLFWCFTRAGFFFFWQGFRTVRQSDFVKYLRQKKNAFFFLSKCPGDRLSSSLTAKKKYESIYASKGWLDQSQVFFFTHIEILRKPFSLTWQNILVEKEVFFCFKTFRSIGKKIFYLLS